MNRTKIILYCLGIGLIIVGLVLMTYSDKLLPVYNCPQKDCNFSPDEIYKMTWIPKIVFFSGLGMIIAGEICIILASKK